MGDDVALHKVGVVEDAAEDALGEQVLDEHLLDGRVGDVGVDGVGPFGEVGRRRPKRLFSLRSFSISASRLWASSGTRSLNSATARSHCSYSGGS